MKRIIFLVAVAISCLAAGIFAGRWWAWRSYSHLVASKQIEAAQIAARLALPLAQLRLGEFDHAILTLEEFMDDQVLMLAYAREADCLDLKSVERIDRCLTPVKLYHDSYQVRGDDVAKMQAFLAGVPGRKADSSCESAVYRLDDLRVSKITSDTNAP